MKSRRGLSVVPGALVAVAAGIALNELLHSLSTDFYLTAADGHLVTLPVSGPRDFFAPITAPDWSRWSDGRIDSTGLTLAIVASIESLLSLEASDKIDPERRVSNPDRELAAQGVGDICAGLLGGSRHRRDRTQLGERIRPRPNHGGQPSCMARWCFCAFCSFRDW